MDLKAVLSNRIYLTDREGLFEELSSQLKHIIIPKFVPQGQRPRPKVILDITRIGGCLTIPSGRQDLIPDDYKIIDKRTCDDVHFPAIAEGLSLREAQQDAVDQVTEGCIINAPPAFGKTYTALFIARVLSMRTLVIVHTTTLRDQWEDEYKLVFGQQCGIVGGGKDTSDKAVLTVGNIQTIRNKGTKWLSQFGVIILDECHHSPSRTFTDVLDKCKATYKIGLSATLKRKDQMEVVLPDYIGGNVIIPPDDGNFLIPTINIIDSKIPLPTGLHWNERLDKLHNNPDYIQLLYDVTRIQEAKGRKVIVLSSRVDLLDMLSEELPEALLVKGATEDRKALLADSESYNVLLGSMQIFSEGISLNHLDCLIIATPINNDSLLEQIVGRVTRKKPGKKDPIVFDIKLSGNTGLNQSNARKSLYISKEWPIKLLT